MDRSLKLAKKPLYIRHSDLRSDGEIYLNIDLCDILNYYVPGYINGVQKRGGVWIIYVKNDTARDHLLNKIITIKYNGRQI